MVQLLSVNAAEMSKHTHCSISINHTSRILHFGVSHSKAVLWCNSCMWCDVASQLITCARASVRASLLKYKVLILALSDAVMKRATVLFIL